MIRSLSLSASLLFVVGAACTTASPRPSTVEPKPAAAPTLQQSVAAKPAMTLPASTDIGKSDAPCTPAETGKTWHVATVEAGSDEAARDGSQARPFLSIQDAANIAQPGDTVLIQPGTYRESVVVPRSGSADKPITFRGCGGRIIISGADPVAGPWRLKPGSTSIYQTELAGNFNSKLNQAEQLFVDGRMMIEARHPNIPHGTLDPLRAEFLSIDGLEVHGDTPGKPPNSGWRRWTIIDNDLDQAPGTWKGASIWLTARHGDGQGGGGWGHRISGTVLKHATGKIQVDTPIAEDTKHIKRGFGEPYYLGGTLAALDAPGEWLRINNKLYFIPPGDGEAEKRAPEDTSIEIKRRDYAFDLSGRSYITLRDLTVVAATITTDHDSGNHGAGGGAHISHRGRNDLAPSTGVVLDGVYAKYVNHFTDMTGWVQGQWVQTSGIVLSGREHVMRNSFVEHAAGNGILVIGERHRITNNLVYGTNYTGVFAAGICMGMESPNRDIEIDHNTVWATGFDGIMVQKLVSSDRTQPARIHHNRVDAFGLLARDVGGIKVVGHHDAGGSRWDHNVVSGGDAWAYGLYWDFATGWVADHNVAYDGVGAVNYNDAHKIQLYNNTLIGRALSLESTTPLRETVVRNNILSHDYRPDKNTGGTVSHNLEFAESSLFVDPAVGNYQLTADASAAIDEGIAVPPYTDNAVPGPSAKRALPDLGAYEYGTEAWRAGAELALPERAPTRLQGTREASGKVTLSWQDHADNERHYYVERAAVLAPNGWLSFDVVAKLPANTTRYVDASREALNDAVYYRVRTDQSLFSNYVVLDASRAAAYWPLAGNLEDAATGDIVNDSASFHAGEQSAKPQFVDGPRKGAKALQFAGSKRNYLKVPSTLEVNPINQMTFLAWLRPDKQDPKMRAVIAQKRPTENGSDGFLIRWQFGDILINFGYGVATFPKPALGEWTLMALVYDGDQMRVYYGGTNRKLKLVLDRKLDKQILRNEEPLYLGGAPRFLGTEEEHSSFFTGRMANVHLYNRVLSKKQILDAGYPTR